MLKKWFSLFAAPEDTKSVAKTKNGNKAGIKTSPQSFKASRAANSEIFGKITSKIVNNIIKNVEI